MNGKTFKLLIAAATIAVSSTFVSCSNDNNFYDPDASHNDALKAYKENFVKAFGQPSPTQSWDFSGYNAPAKTRGDIQVWKQIGYTSTYGNEPKDYYTLNKNLKADFNTIKEKVSSVDSVKWDYTYSHMYLQPVLSHGYKDAYDYYSLGIEYTTANDETVSTDPSEFRVAAKYNRRDSWYSIKGALNSGGYSLTMDTWREVTTESLVNQKSARWWVGFQPYDSETTTKKTVNYVKMFTIEGRTYVCFDCDGDQDYSDLICLMTVLSSVQKPEPFEGKRYMVEDLGGQDHGDFDFNDIVFDVVEIDGQKKCQVRALGGTLDIEIVVGTSHWRKGANEGREKQFIVTKMYNTEDPETQQAEILDEFDVEGWDPNENNVSVIVYGKDTKYAIPFPEDGDIPLMVATKLTKLWRVERDPVPSAPAWFMED